MLYRLVCFALVTAVIACPVVCAQGLCHASHCCPPDKDQLAKDLSAVCPLHSMGRACCPAQENDEDAPFRFPGKPRCQGVCGGAVLEKTSEVKVVETSWYLPVAHRDGSVVWLLAHFHSLGRDCACITGGKNYGRLTRTVLSSFLC